MHRRMARLSRGLNILVVVALLVSALPAAPTVAAPAQRVSLDYGSIAGARWWDASAPGTVEGEGNGIAAPEKQPADREETAQTPRQGGEKVWLKTLALPWDSKRPGANEPTGGSPGDKPLLTGLYVVALSAPTAISLTASICVDPITEDSYACPGNDSCLSGNECPFGACEGTTTYYTENPINTCHGNYNYEQTDFSLPTAGDPLSFERAYNSFTGGVSTDTVVYSSTLGYGWTHNWDINLTFPTDPGGVTGTVILKSLHGSRLYFVDKGSGVYEPYPGVWATTTPATTSPA